MLHPDWIGIRAAFLFTDSPENLGYLELVDIPSECRCYLSSPCARGKLCSTTIASNPAGCNPVVCKYFSIMKFCCSVTFTHSLATRETRGNLDQARRSAMHSVGTRPNRLCCKQTSNSLTTHSPRPLLHEAHVLLSCSFHAESQMTACSLRIHTI